MWLPDRTGTARCGLLDFQDALSGARAYDLMSLVEDARRDVASDLKEHLIQRYLAAMEDIDESALRHEMAVLGAGRHAKVIGIFTRLSRRDGKSQYLAHIPHVWSLLGKQPRASGIVVGRQLVQASRAGRAARGPQFK